ncbi:hypothetical protein M5K25_019199 [Dendrobium thyrsiflorum]|uniref:Uncharacterized protein n=1 Tax=Dendrobium thyrsiflorum TaxID=117978 RepID=A0ABD0UEC3_DENTH
MTIFEGNGLKTLRLVELCSDCKLSNRISEFTMTTARFSVVYCVVRITVMYDIRYLGYQKFQPSSQSVSLGIRIEIRGEQEFIGFTGFGRRSALKEERWLTSQRARFRRRRYFRSNRRTARRNLADGDSGRKTRRETGERGMRKKALWSAFGGAVRLVAIYSGVIQPNKQATPSSSPSSGSKQQEYKQKYRKNR